MLKGEQLPASLEKGKMGLLVSTSMDGRTPLCLWLTSVIQN